MMDAEAGCLLLKKQPLIPKVIFFLITCSNHRSQELNVVIRKFYLEKSTHNVPWKRAAASISCLGKCCAQDRGRYFALSFCIAQRLRLNYSVSLNLYLLNLLIR